MSYKIRFTHSAKNDLLSVKKYIYEDNFEASKRVVEHIINEIEILKDNPSIGKAGRIVRTRELVISKYPYIVPYQLKDNIIYILRVLHTSRKW